VRPAGLLIALLLLGPVGGPARAGAEGSPPEDDPAPDPAPDRTPDRAHRWTLFPVIGSAPEISLMLGGVTMLHFQGSDDPDLDERRAAARRSSIGLFAAYTLKNQFLLSLWPSIYLRGDTWHLSGSVDANWFPDTIYDTGRKSPADSAEDFTQRAFGVNVFATRRVVRALRAGLRGMAVHATLTEVEPGGLLDTDQMPGSRGGFAIGLGPAVAWDDRDQDMAPRTGSRVELSIGVYHHALGSDYDYTQITLDARHYFPLPRTHVLAVQVYGQLGSGEVPFQAQAHLGGDSRLRGYFAGRYHDVHMMAAQVEYRLPLYWRLGGTLFAGAGDVAGNVHEFDLLDLKYAGGFGLRLALNQKDRVNLRGDFAVTSEGDRAFYLSLGEAF